MHRSRASTTFSPYALNLNDQQLILIINFILRNNCNAIKPHLHTTISPHRHHQKWFRFLVCQRCAAPASEECCRQPQRLHNTNIKSAATDVTNESSSPPYFHFISLPRMFVSGAIEFGFFLSKCAMSSTYSINCNRTTCGFHHFFTKKYFALCIACIRGATVTRKTADVYAIITIDSHASRVTIQE